MKTIMLGWAALLCTSVSVHALEIRLQLQSEDYQGPASYEILADRIPVASGTVTADPVIVEVPDEMKVLGVRFTNDLSAPIGEGRVLAPGEDRNLIIVGVSIGGKDIPTGEITMGPGMGLRGNDVVMYTAGTAEISVVEEQSSKVAQSSDDAPELAINRQNMEASGDASICTTSINIGEFAVGSTTLDKSLKEQVAALVVDSSCEYTVTGYSSTAGSRRVNEQISLARAQAVADELISVGIAKDRLVVVAGGETDQFGEVSSANRVVTIQTH